MLTHLSLIVGLLHQLLLILLVLDFLNIFGLVAISEPIVKIVSEFFQDVHVVPNGSASLTILRLALSSIFELDPASLRGQFGSVAEVVHVATLYLAGRSTGTVAIGTHTAERLAMDLSVHVIVVVAVRVLIEPIPFVRTLLRIIVVRSSHHRIVCEITLNVLVVSNLIKESDLGISLLARFIVLQGRALVDVLRVLARKLLFCPLDQIGPIKETIFVFASFPLVHFDLFQFGVAKFIITVFGILVDLQLGNSNINILTRIFFVFCKFNVLLLEVDNSLEDVSHFVVDLVSRLLF